MQMRTCPKCKYRGRPTSVRRGSDLGRIFLAIVSLGLWFLYVRTAGRPRIACRKCGEILGFDDA